jgi:hypothetical protein
MKKLTLALLAVAAVLVAAFAYLWMSPGQTLKRAIEREGSAICGAPVRVESVAWSPQTHTYIVSGFAIGNPLGFAPGDVLTAPVVEIGVAADGGDKAVIRVTRLIVSSPSVHLDSGPSGSNFEALERHIKKQPPAPDARRFVVELLALQNAKVRIGAGGETDLLGIRNRDVGGDRGGITAIELARETAEELGQRVRLSAGIENIKSGIKNLFGE